MRKLFIILILLIALVILVVSIYVERSRRTNSSGILVSSVADIDSVAIAEKVNVPDKQPDAGVYKQTFTAKASWYGRESCSTPLCLMANGQTFDPSALTTACLPPYNLGTKFAFIFGGKRIEAICTDRGGFEKYGRQFDFSEGLFRQFTDPKRGVIEVYVEVIK